MTSRTGWSGIFRPAPRPFPRLARFHPARIDQHAWTAVHGARAAAWSPLPPLHLPGVRAQRHAGTSGNGDTCGHRESDGRQDRGSRRLRRPRETRTVTSHTAPSPQVMVGPEQRLAGLLSGAQSKLQQARCARRWLNVRVRREVGREVAQNNRAAQSDCPKHPRD